ncbi:Alcohol dehydrogenase, iron-type [Purpureocillium lavendulum]|uniref:Alcohol dehydrogenase, iron-type n=1 Tax=Purpureocillium lavendulum TaxID=1247861 RepID=A0AB34FSN4_9HYPO|nr:Alcohol dehydrogenase, iron-type [Purpureocillium lavendulum]
MSMSLSLHNAAVAGDSNGCTLRRQASHNVGRSSVIEQEESIRAYWMIDMLDSMTSLGSYNSYLTLKLPLGAHLPISESEWSRGEPVIESFLNEPHDLTTLEKRLEWQTAAQSLDERLTHWREEFVADVFRLINAEKDTLPHGEMEPLITLTNCILNTAIIVLLQQMAPFPWEIGRDFEPWAFATTRCVYACENLVAKIRRISPDQQDCQSPYLIFPIFAAARFYVAYSKALDADVPASLHYLAFNLHICAVSEHRSPISQCVLPIQFYDLRHSTLAITDLLQVTAEKIDPGRAGRAVEN